MTTDRFTVPLPEAGEGAFLRFGVSECAKLQGLIQEKTPGTPWVRETIDGLLNINAATMASCLICGLKNAPADAAELAPWSLPWTSLADRVADALMLRVYGKTVAELNAAAA